MKNFTLLIAVTILSVGMVYANIPHHNAVHPTGKPVAPSPNKITMPGMTPITPANKSAMEKLAQSRSLVPIYDSLVEWVLDTPSLTWAYDYKAIDITYDSHQDISGYTGQTRNGTKWVNSDQYIYTYNSNKDYLTEEELTWNGSAYVANYQYIYTYSGNNETSYAYQTWNGSAWVTQWMYSYGYDGNNNETSYTYQDLVSGVLTNDYQYLFTYTGNNQTNETDYSWSSGWVPTYQYTYGYDANNNDTSELDEEYESGSWVDTYHWHMTYNTNNELTLQIEEEYEAATWVNDNYYAEFYNSNNYETGDLYEYWNGVAWADNELDTMTYNGSNQETNYLDETWSGTAWQNNYQDNYTYDGNGNELTDNYQVWNSGWVNDEQYTYTYNSSNSETSQLYEEAINGTLVYGYLDNYGYDVNNIEEWFTEREWNSAGDTIVDGDSAQYYYSVAEGINLVSNNFKDVQIYPNPSNSFVHADIQLNQNENLQLRMVNMLGQTVWNADAGNVSNYENNISVANLADGVYLLEMVTGSGIQSRQVVVTH